ncbi:hypothetical protein D5E69_22970 (plasmid) [Rossellomorea marisflavi]|uniref:hypothetical protein n=1 Tax=Rossellomorea marisflavi TaxID=189381 RepID=UPI001317E9EB|nr:hypothetical protein [Rossellomorea marisflavi]QHA38700.1 hypothetical protein D5E69_22970 [Rossellomorea marisflavi]
MTEELFKLVETEDNPKMLEVYLEQAWQSTFCYGLALEQVHSDKPPIILMSILAGSDSTLQAMKAAMDIGSSGFRFGYGEKGLTNYEFKSEFGLVAEKGAYERFPITINQNKKAMAIVHEKLLLNNEYILCFENNPSEDVATLLGGAKYGLHILDDWKMAVYEELIRRKFIEEVDIYFDHGLFPEGISLLRINLEEEQADKLISDMIQSGTLQFPKKGSGSALSSLESLTDYMVTFSDDMVTKLSDEVIPDHDPMKDEILPHFDNYPRQLFPVQGHVSTAIAKRLTKQKAVIIQGQMSTGKSSMMTAITDGYHELINKKGYFACLMCPPSLTKKWPLEIKELIPDAEIHVIKNTATLIQWHQNWVAAGRNKPTRPTFFIVSFTTMRNDSRSVPAVDFRFIKTKRQASEGELPYRFGYYCRSCGEAHQIIEAKSVVVNEDGSEEEVLVKKTMEEFEFGSGRRNKDSSKPQNSFCSECGESLWTKKVPNRYASFSEWIDHEKKLLYAINHGNQTLYKHEQLNQNSYPKATGMPRRIAAIEYIRRKMKNFFDLSIVDEVHERVTRCYISSGTLTAKLAVQLFLS